MAFNGRFVMNIAHFAAEQGADLDKLIWLSGKSAEELCNESCTVENEVYNKVLVQASEDTGDEHFGLHAGENLNLTAAGLIIQITQTSETVKQALEYCCEFANLGCSALPMQLFELNDQYKVTMTPNELWLSQSPTAVRHTAEGNLAFMIKEFHALTRMKHNPLAIHVTWQKPKNTSEYERVFGCPVLFNKPEIALLLKKEHVEERVVTANYDLLKLLVAYAEEKSSRIQQDEGFAALVKRSMIKMVKPEFPTIDQVAGHLNVSLRTLQRRLYEEGHTYKELVDELRKDFALSYLKRPDLTISQIAYLLNYADNSAFTRSFKRWTGKSPKAYRNG